MRCHVMELRFNVHGKTIFMNREYKTHTDTSFDPILVTKQRKVSKAIHGRHLLDYYTESPIRS